jgi:hypothetical protein
MATITKQSSRQGMYPLRSLRMRQAMRVLAGIGICFSLSLGLGQVASAEVNPAPAPLTAPALASSPPSVTRTIGEITLSIGAAEIQRAGQLQAVAKGGSIQPGDIIRTTASGHVHVRFVDGALLSVRPQSVLHVQEYRYDAARPAESLVKFYLETGTVREISGRAAQLAKEKFRLNTPLVAIGVRGTDFITQVTEQTTAVLVNQGAIVFTPLDNVCTASGFGPCQTARSHELADTAGNMALVYSSATAEPVLQPVHTLKGLERATPLLQQKAPGEAGVGEIVSELKNPEAVLDVVKPGQSLIWGRWAQGKTLGDELTVPFAEAMKGNRVTVGDGYYFLFRNENIPNLLASMDEKVNFRLQAGAAQYRAPSNEISVATLHNGTLGIDFGRNTFKTEVTVSAPTLGNEVLSASGSIDRHTGIFLNQSDQTGTRVSGAVALDASQAGYLFHKPVGHGAISGATLWGR